MPTANAGRRFTTPSVRLLAAKTRGANRPLVDTLLVRFSICLDLVDFVQVPPHRVVRAGPSIKVPEFSFNFFRPRPDSVRKLSVSLM